MKHTKTLGGVVALAAAISIALPSVANAATYASYGSGQGLNSSLFGIAPPVGLGPATAVNDGSTPQVVNNTPVSFTVLGNTVFSLPSNTLGLPSDPFGSVIQMGAIGQYAEANNDGSSSAFSGSASQVPGLISLSNQANFNAGDVLGDPGANAMTLQLGDPASSPVSIGATFSALAAAATEDASGAQSGVYDLGNVTIVMGGTLVASLISGLDSLVSPLLTAMDAAGVNMTGITDPFQGINSITLSGDQLALALGATNLNALPPNTNLLAGIPGALENWAATQISNLLGTAQGAINTAAAAIIPGGCSGLAALDPACALFDTVDAALSTLQNIDLGTNSLIQSLLSPISAAIDALAQVTVNVQYGQGGTGCVSTDTKCNGKAGDNGTGSFTERAVELGLGPTASLASFDIASATVGPNIVVADAETPIFNAGSLTVGIVIILMAVAGWFLVSSRRRAIA